MYLIIQLVPGTSIPIIVFTMSHEHCSTSTAQFDTHHDVVRVEDGHVLEDFPGHPDEFGCDQTADRKHGDAPMLWRYNRNPGRAGGQGMT